VILMTMIDVDAAGLELLRNHALRVGTLELWSEVAIEWAKAAEAEIAKLRAQISTIQADTSGRDSDGIRT